MSDLQDRRTRQEYALRGTWGEVPLSSHPKVKDVDKLITRAQRDGTIFEAMAVLYGWHMDGRLTDDRFRRLVYQLSGKTYRQYDILFRPGSALEQRWARRILRLCNVHPGSKQAVSELVLHMQITSDHARDIQNALIPYQPQED